MLKEVINWFEDHNTLSWTVTVLIAIFIFYVSSLSFEKGAPSAFGEIKSFLYHLLVFFVFAFFLSLSLVKGDYKNKIFIFIATMLAIAYGASDEIHQLTVPNRVGDIFDLLTDSIGIILANILYIIRLNNHKFF